MFIALICRRLHR